MFEYVRDAVSGPGALRFIIQPLFAALLGIRDGWRDAKTGRTPYLFYLLTGSGHRKEILREGVKQILVPLCIGFLLDVILRLVMGFGFHPLESAIVGTVLIGLPYIALRSITDRLLRRRYKGKQAG